MGRVGFLGPTALLPVAAGLALGACGGGSGDGLPPVEMQTGVVATDLDGDGLPDVVTGESPQVLYNDPAQPGTLPAARLL